MKLINACRKLKIFKLFFIIFVVGLLSALLFFPWNGCSETESAEINENQSYGRVDNRIALLKRDKGVCTYNADVRAINKESEIGSPSDSSLENPVDYTPDPVIYGEYEREVIENDGVVTNIEYRRADHRYPFVRKYPADKKIIFYDDTDNLRDYEVPVYSKSSCGNGIDFIINGKLHHNVIEVFDVERVSWFQGEQDQGPISEGPSTKITAYRVEHSSWGEIPYSTIIYNPDGLVVKEEKGFISKNTYNVEEKYFGRQDDSNKELPAFEPVTIKDGGIIVGNSRYFIKGLTYSPATIGQVQQTLQFDYTVAKRDVALMEELGINTIRTYYPIEDERILDLFAYANIKIIMGFPYYDDRYKPGPDVASSRYIDYIKKFRNHPAILLWEFGNEYDLLAKLHPDWFEGDIRNWHAMIPDVVRTVKEIDSNHPVSTVIANDFDLLGYRISREVDRLNEVDALKLNLKTNELKRIVDSYPDVDLIGVNVYFWDDPSYLIDSWHEISSKPLYFAEAGTDSYDQRNQREIRDLQAEFVLNIWKNLKKYLNYDTKGNFLGVTFMTFCDEWWKHGKDPMSYEPAAGFAHDPVPPDGFANEQCWGWVDARRKPKKVFYIMQEEFLKSETNRKNSHRKPDDKRRTTGQSGKVPYKTMTSTLQLDSLKSEYEKLPVESLYGRYNADGKLSSQTMIIYDGSGEKSEQLSISIYIIDDGFMRKLISDNSGRMLADLLIDDKDRIINETVFVGAQKIIKQKEYDRAGDLIAENVYLNEVSQERILWHELIGKPCRVTDIITINDISNLNLSDNPEEIEDWKFITGLILEDPILEAREISALDGSYRIVRYYLQDDPKRREFFKICFDEDRINSVYISTRFNHSGRSIHSYELTPDFRIAASLRESEFKTSISAIFTPEIITAYDKLHHSPVTLINKLKGLGIESYTGLYGVIEKRKLLEMDSDSRIVYGKNYGRESILYPLKNDPRDRYIARIEHDKKTILYPWWWEGDTVTLRGINNQISSELPVGILPGSLIFVDNRLEETHIFDDKVSSPYFDGQTGYKFNIAGKNDKRSVILSRTGKILAETSAYVVCKLANGKLGTALSGEETQYYDPYLFYNMPTVAVVEYLGRDGITERFFSKKFEMCKFSVTSTGSQIAEFYANETEPLAPAKTYVQKYEYLDGRLISKKRDDVFASWLKEKNSAITILLVIVIISAVFYTTGELIGKIRRRYLYSIITNTSDLSSNTDYCDKKRNSCIEISFPSSMFGFSKNIAGKAEEIILSVLKRRVKRGQSSDEFACEFFEKYAKWRKGIAGNSNISENNKFDIRDVYLYYLIHLSAGIFSNTVPSFINFLFFKCVELPDVDMAGKFTEENIRLWTKIMTANMGRLKNKAPQEKYLTYNDMEDLFRTPEFVANYHANLDKFNKYASGEDKENIIKKTFPDRCGGFIGLTGIWAIAKNCILPVYIIAIMFYILLIIWLPIDLWLSGLIIISLSSLLCRILMIRRKKDLWTKNPVSPEEEANVKKKSMFTGIYETIFWIIIFIVKFAWNYYLFSCLKIPISVLMRSSINGIPHTNIILVLMIILPFVVFYVLDLFTFYYFGQSIVSFFAGKWNLVNNVNTWKDLSSQFDQASICFRMRLLPESLALTQTHQEIAWTVSWNMIIDNLYEEDKLSVKEVLMLKYKLKSRPGNFFNKKIMGKPDLSIPPANLEARKRLIGYISSLFMDIPRIPEWEKLFSFSVMVPVYNEAVVYTMDELTTVENTDITKLGYLINRYPDEWINFLDRMKKLGFSRTHELIPNDENPENLPDITNIRNKALAEEIRLWASYRFQPLARTIRGIMTYVKALEFHAQINYPDADEDTIRKKISELFQCVVGYQDYGCLDMNNPRKIALDALLAKYHFFELAYIEKTEIENEENWFSVLIGYDAEIGCLSKKSRIQLPGKPIIGEGKPCNQNNILKHIRGEKIQFLDVNQDLFFEESIKVLNLLEEFRREPDVKIVGFPEEIFTESYGAQAANYAFADKVFSNFVQRFLSLMKIRLHYGHPDFIDSIFIKQTGFISPSEVNEDIFGAYKTLIYGGNIIFREYIRAGKARDVNFNSISVFYSKLGMGAVQQGLSRWTQRVFSSPSISLSAKLTHFMTLGFFLRKPLIVFGLLTYLVLVLFMGISGFISFPSELIFGFLAIAFAQVITFPGLVQLISEKGLLSGIALFLRRLPSMMLCFMAHVFIFDAAARKAVKGRACYLATGRRWMLNHIPAFSKDENICSIYGMYDGSYLRTSFFCIMIGILGIYLWRSINIMWSGLFILMPVSAFLTPFISNPASLPIIHSYNVWKTLNLKDFNNWLDQVKFKMEVIRLNFISKSTPRRIYDLIWIIVIGILIFTILFSIGGLIGLIKLALNSICNIFFNLINEVCILLIKQDSIS